MNSLKRYLTAHGASLVGFAKLSGVSESYPRGVAIAIALDKSVVLGIHERPTMEYFEAYHELNRRLDELALMCERYLTERGYSALAQTTDRVREDGGYVTSLPHKTVAARGGLGWIGKSALLVTPEYGGAVRLTSVLTDAPLDCDEPLTERCGSCMICKNACPAGAVTGNAWRADKGRDWIFDAVKCRETARAIALKAIDKQITLCGKCFEVCPWTRRYLDGELNKPQGALKA